MAINLRYVSKELHQALKVRAVTEDVTIESLCVRFLWQGLEFMAGGDSTRVDLGSQPETAPKFLSETEAAIGKTDMQALRDICAGKIEPRTKEEFVVGFGHAMARGELLMQEPKPLDLYEIPICGKQWWEDGEHYECLMDAGHREQKHGMRGMVRRVD